MGWLDFIPLQLPSSTNYWIFNKVSELSVTSPSSILLFVDTAPGNICYSAFVIYTSEGANGLFFHRPSVEHNNVGVVSFVDGHVETHKWVEPATIAAAQGNWLMDHVSVFMPGNRDLDWLREHASAHK